MAQGIRVGIIGAGWPGLRHAEGYQLAGGFQVTAVADLIPGRRRKLMDESGAKREYADAHDLLKDVQVDAVSVCLPNALHLPVALAALKAGKHVICETPPTLNAGEARKLSAAATKAGRTLLYGFQRRFGARNKPRCLQLRRDTLERLTMSRRHGCERAAFRPARAGMPTVPNPAAER